MQNKLPSYKFCPKCGKDSLELEKSRQKCLACGFIYYHHTPLTVACVVLDRDKILLVKRDRAPFKGRWSLPAGFLEFGEHPIPGGLRELYEETGLIGDAEELLGIYIANDHPKTFSLLTIIKVEIVDGKFLANDDVSEVKFFNLNKLPRLAFKAHEEVVSRIMLESLSE